MTVQNGFELHGVQHLSASSLNLWSAEPALWVMERLLGLRGPGNAMMARGKAVEEGIHAGLVDSSKTVEECAAIALSAYDKEMALIQDEKRDSERQNIPGYVEHGLAELRQYGVPTAYQDRVEYRLGPADAESSVSFRPDDPHRIAGKLRECRSGRRIRPENSAAVPANNRRARPM